MENTTGFWNTMVMERLTSLGALRASMPSIATDPPSGRSSMFTIRRSVVFPAPLGPMMAITSPSSTSRLTFRRICFSPADLHRPFTITLIAYPPAASSAPG
jgi:hypothetical protein